MKKIKNLLFTFLAFLILISLINAGIIFSTSKCIFNNTNTIPENYAALVLGTSKFTSGGNNNPFFIYRINAAAELYHSKKIKKIIVSGDNKHKSYNEPDQMKKSLIKKGVASEDIIQDFAGFRTLDSVVRSKKVFQQSKITIISQKFHLERAIFIANHYNMDAIGFASKSPSINIAFKTFLREFFAKVKAFIDVYIIKTEPKFLGPVINI